MPCNSTAGNLALDRLPAVVPLDGSLLPVGQIDQMRHGSGSMARQRILSRRFAAADTFKEVLEMGNGRFSTLFFPTFHGLLHSGIPAGRNFLLLHFRVAVISISQFLSPAVNNLSVIVMDPLRIEPQRGSQH